jgi:hypothetical protein
MRFRSILLLGVSSVALQHADAQTAGVNGVPGSNVIVPKYIPYNRPAYIVPGSVDRPYVSTPAVATPIYVPPTFTQLPLVTNGLPGYNAPLNTMPTVVNGNPQTPFGAGTPFGANAPIVGQSRTDFAAQPSIQSTFQPNFQASSPPTAPGAAAAPIAPNAPPASAVPIAPSAPPTK